ncbi:MAG: DUF3791 domain-containing protein [Verrucomicrobia bacterium]|jgi:hypothetical protein|nr:DUF3791 domain-containing protein [Verrucomicrobiota bacterium]
MSGTVYDKIEYIVMFVHQFAKQHTLTDSEAYHYIRNHRGLELIDECYDVMHTQSFPDMIEAMVSFCKRNGGTLG